MRNILTIVDCSACLGPIDDVFKESMLLDPVTLLWYQNSEDIVMTGLILLCLTLMAPSSWALDKEPVMEVLDHVVKVVADDDEAFGINVVVDHNSVPAKDHAHLVFTLNKFDRKYLLKYRNIILFLKNDNDTVKFIDKLRRQDFLLVNYFVVIATISAQDVFKAFQKDNSFPNKLLIIHYNDSDVELYMRRCTWLQKIDTLDEFCQDYPDKLCIDRSVPFRIGAFHYPPSVIEVEKADGTLEHNGYEVALARSIIDNMGMSHVIRRPQSNVMWDGLFWDVQGDIADVGLGQFYMYPEKHKFPYFTPPFDFSGSCFLMKRPPIKANWTGLILPFQWFCWIWIGISLISVALTMAVWVHLDPHENIKTGPAIISVYGSIVGQGTPLDPRSVRLMSFICLFGLCGLVLNNTYSGSLLSFLAVTFEPPVFQEVKALINFEGGIASIFNYMDWQFQGTGDPDYIALKSKGYFIGVGPNDMEKAVNLTGEGKLTLVDTKVTLEYHIRNQFVDAFGETRMYIMDQCWKHNLISLVTLKNTPISREFNKRVTMAFEAGLVDKYKIQELDKIAKKSLFQSRVISGTRRLSMSEDFKGIFGLCGLLYGLAAFIFVFEQIFGYRAAIFAVVKRNKNRCVRVARMICRFPCCHIQQEGFDYDALPENRT